MDDVQRECEVGELWMEDGGCKEHEKNVEEGRVRKKGGCGMGY